ncbi:DUF2953 domain-containing protein [Alicyclobacillus acidiphilus]|uniref:DUF2953 domain-containing protein n=1 Tax=Alicyclobacillus acidiphilus TaxID=182455 RepID=UPI000836E6BC|nr:DUF2953 domain-containing protein [Alicyclobacillus acidiphilus]
MVWIFLIAAAVIALFAIVLMLPVDIHVQYERVRANDKGSVEIRTLLGLVRLRRELTEVTAGMSSEGPAVRAEAGPPGKEKQDDALTTKELPKLTDQVREIWQFARASLGIARRTLRYVRVRELRVEAHIGLTDSVYTGVSVGLLYAILETAFGWLSYRCHFDDKPDVHIQPVFHQNAFQLRTKSILRIRMGHAISAGIRLLFAWKRRTS